MTLALGGRLCGKLHLHVPLYGVATAEVELLEATVLSGAQPLSVGDLTLTGTIIDGGPVAGQGRYHWRAGAGAWGTVVDGRGYGNSLGVQRTAVIRELAAAIGETVRFELPEVRLGLAPEASYVRLGGPAWLALKALAVPWYVHADGVTVIGERASAPAPESTAMLVAWAREDGRRVYHPSAEIIAGWLPGNTLGAEQIVSLDVEAMPGQPLRLTVYTRASGDISHDWRTQFDQIVEQDTAHHRFFGSYRYTVASRSGDLYGLVPVRADLGLPIIGGAALDNAVGVGQFPGAAGHSADLPNGYGVVVGFLDGDPGAPFIVGFQRLDNRSGALLPVTSRFDASSRLDIGDADALVARESDKVNVSSFVLTGPFAAGPIQTWLFTLTPAFGLPTVYQLIASTAGTIVSFSILPGGGNGVTTGLIDTPTQTKVYA